MVADRMANMKTKGRDMKSKSEIRRAIAGLKVEKENCTAAVELELQGLVNWLKARFPDAPDCLLWAVAKYEPNARDKVAWNRREAARIQRRIREMARRGKIVLGR